ncbi:HNH endonuclease [Chloroflexota bacterium]
MTVLFILPPRRRVIELAEERKKRLDETRQFYSSPEWQLIRKQIIKEKGRVCSDCKIYIRSNIDITVDHIRPRSKYPDFSLDKNNLQVLCRSCNSSKGATDSEISAFG